MNFQNQNPQVGLFIDLENIAVSLWKAAEQQPRPSALIAQARKYGLIGFARAYADFDQELFRQMETGFRNSNIEPFRCPVKERGEYTQSTVDMNIVIDLYEMAQDRPDIDTFVLMAGDSDYVRVVGRLRHRFGKRVIVAGVPGTVSRDLVQAAGEEDPIEAIPLDLDAERLDAIIQLIDEFERTRYEGVLPTFRSLANYLRHPRNHDLIDPSLVEGLLADLERRGVLRRQLERTPEDAEVRTIRLDHDSEFVEAALTDSYGG